MPKPIAKISVLTLAMMNVAIIMSLRGLPLMAKEGYSLFFYLLFSAVVFFIPTALISAELATGWPTSGGVYSWVKEALGPKAGFVAIFLQWIQNIIWYPTVLAFAAGALSYLFGSPELAQNKWFNFLVILGIYWGATAVNFHGLKTSGKLSSLAVLLGTIFPGIIIIVLGIAYVAFNGSTIQTSQSSGFLPNFSNFSNVAFLASIVLLFAGIEVTAVHAKEVENPSKDYPKAILLSTIIILGIFTLGSMAIAFIVPKDEISLTAGIMQAFSVIFRKYHVEFILPFIGFLVFFGTIGGVTSWIIGPSKGLLRTAKDGDIPPVLSKTNRNKAPVNILIIQGVIVTSITLLYLFMPTVSSAFFILSDLTALCYLIMYLLLYVSGITLRYTRKNVERSYKIPFGNFGMWVVSIVGIIGALFAIAVGLFPPSQLEVGNKTFYISFILIGLFILVLVPIVIHSFKNPSWLPEKDEEEEY